MGFDLFDLADCCLMMLSLFCILVFALVVLYLLHCRFAICCFDLLVICFGLLICCYCFAFELVLGWVWFAGFGCLF